MNKHAKYHERRERIQHVNVSKTVVIRDYHVGDEVFYTGEKYRGELMKDGKPMKGYVHSYIDGTSNTYVIEFPEAKHPDYALSTDFLSRARPEAKQNSGVEVQSRRRKTEEE